MIPVIHINGQELFPRHVQLIRKLLLDEIMSTSNTIWESNSQPNADTRRLGVFPHNRVHAFNTLQMIDGIVPVVHCPEGPYGTYITLNGAGMHPWYGDSIRSVVNFDPLYLQLTEEEQMDRQFMMNAVFLKT